MKTSRIDMLRGMLAGVNRAIKEQGETESLIRLRNHIINKGNEEKNMIEAVKHVFPDSELLED